MTVLAKLKPRVQLINEEKRERHPAFVAYERLRPQLAASSALNGELESIESFKRRLDEMQSGAGRSSDGQ